MHRVQTPTQEKTQGSYGYHSLQVNLPNSFLTSFEEVQSFIDSSCVYEEDEDKSYGLEDEPHVTVCYGIKEESDYFFLLKNLKGLDPIIMEIGNISFFRNSDTPYDVAILEIECPVLPEINEFVRRFCKPYVSFSEYTPHMTLGYIQSNSCLDMPESCILTGQEVRINALVFSHRDNYKILIPLTGES